MTTLNLSGDLLDNQCRYLSMCPLPWRVAFMSVSSEDRKCNKKGQTNDVNPWQLLQYAACSGKRCWTWHHCLFVSLKSHSRALVFPFTAQCTWPWEFFPLSEISTGEAHAVLPFWDRRIPQSRMNVRIGVVHCDSNALCHMNVKTHAQMPMFPMYCAVLLTKFTLALQMLCKLIYGNHETMLVAPWLIR